MNKYKTIQWNRVRSLQNPSRRIRFVIPVVLALTFLLPYCVTPMGMAPSNIPLSPDQIEKTLGKAEGASSVWAFSPLCMISIGHPDFDEAIQMALTSTQGDALVDLRWYKKDACFLLFTWDKLYLSGVAVKLKPKEDEASKKKKK